MPSECVEVDSVTTCELGDIPAGESRTLVFSGTVAAGTPVGTRLTLSARVSSDGTLTATVLDVAQPV